jgi:protein-tyrosine phosphatase
MFEPPLRITFVCMGNICRSPTAHGVMRHKLQQAGLADRVEVSSAGTHAWHEGEPPDPRSQQHARRRGYDLSDLRARRLQALDFEQSHLVLVMDWDNLALAEELCPDEHRARLKRLTEFCRRFDTPVVPDPYAGGPRGFEEVLDLVEDACDGVLAHVQRALGRPPLPLP